MGANDGDGDSRHSEQKDKNTAGTAKATKDHDKDDDARNVHDNSARNDTVNPSSKPTASRPDNSDTRSETGSAAAHPARDNRLSITSLLAPDLAKSQPNEPRTDRTPSNKGLHTQAPNSSNTALKCTKRQTTMALNINSVAHRETVLTGTFMGVDRHRVPFHLVLTR